MPKRTLIELVHVAAGLAAAVLLGKLSAWAYPLGKADIWLVTWVAMAITVAMGAGPVLRAWRTDQAEARGTHTDG